MERRPVEFSAELTPIYVLVGLFVCTFGGAIVGFIVWLSRLGFRVEHLEKDVNAAHEKLRGLGSEPCGFDSLKKEKSKR